MSYYGNNGIRTPRGDAEHLHPPGSGERHAYKAPAFPPAPRWADNVVYYLLGDDMVRTEASEFLADVACENRRAWRFNEHSLLCEWHYGQDLREYEEQRRDQRLHDTATRRGQP